MAADGFFFDVEKWFGSVSAQRMSFAEKGVYLVMMFEQWRAVERSLPNDPQAVADLIAVSESQVAEVVAAWPVVRRKFVQDERTPERIQNLAMEKTRRQQAANRRKRVTAGQIAGKVSAAKRRAARELHGNDSLTTVERSLNTPERLPTDQIRSEKSREEERGLDQSRELVALWNERVRPPLSAVSKITPKRRKHVAARWSEHPSMDEWAAIIDRIQASAFCRGETANGNWLASFDWLIGSPDSAVKVLEGKYDERRHPDRRAAPHGPDRRVSTAEHNEAVINEWLMRIGEEPEREH